MATATMREEELEVAAILCDLKRILRARDRRRKRAPVIPSWGRRRLRSALLEDAKPTDAAAVPETNGKPSARRDGAASPDTPLAFPEEDEEVNDDDAARKAEWMQEQRGVVASLSQENADLLKQIEEYRARLLSSRSANESLKQLHKVRQEQEHARKTRAVASPSPRHPALGLDLNEPAADEEERRSWQLRKAAEARRRRLGILRARAAVSSCRSRTRRVVG